MAVAVVVAVAEAVAVVVVDVVGCVGSTCGRVVVGLGEGRVEVGVS